MSGTHFYKKFSSPTLQQVLLLADNFHYILLYSAKSAILSSIIDQRESVEISEFVKTTLPKMHVMREVVRDNIEEYKKYSKKILG